MLKEATASAGYTFDVSAIAWPLVVVAINHGLQLFGIGKCMAALYVLTVADLQGSIESLRYARFTSNVVLTHQAFLL